MVREVLHSYIQAGPRNFGVYPRAEIPVEMQHPFVRAFIDRLPSNNDIYKQLLFLACGNGGADFQTALEAEAKLGPIRSVFMDIQPEVIMEQVARFFPIDQTSDYTQNRKFDKGSIPTFAVWDLNASQFLPFESSTLAGVYFRYAMHWLEYPFFIMRELARVLKPGGVGYIATATPYSLPVMNETFRSDTYSKEEIQLWYPEATIEKGDSTIYPSDVWVVSHAKEVETHFERYPHHAYYTRVKARGSTLPGKTVTGFLPRYFESTANSYGLKILGLETEVSPGFPNQFKEPDPRSQTGIHVLLGKQ